MYPTLQLLEDEGLVRSAERESKRVYEITATGREEAARRIVRAVDKRLPFYAFPKKMVWRLRLLRCLPTSWQDDWIRKMMRPA